MEISPDKLHKVIKQPAGNGGVIHHQDIVAGDVEPFCQVPLASLGLQCLIGKGYGFLGCTAVGKLHHHDGQAEDHQKHQINQYKSRSAVLSHDIRKAPHISETDGTAC